MSDLAMSDLKPFMMGRLSTKQSKPENAPIKSDISDGHIRHSPSFQQHNILSD